MGGRRRLGWPFRCGCVDQRVASASRGD